MLLHLYVVRAPTPRLHLLGNKTLCCSLHTCDRYTCHQGQSPMCSNSNHIYYIEFVTVECKGQLLILRSLQIVWCVSYLYVSAVHPRIFVGALTQHYMQRFGRVRWNLRAQKRPNVTSTSFVYLLTTKPSLYHFFNFYLFSLTVDDNCFSCDVNLILLRLNILIGI